MKKCFLLLVGFDSDNKMQCIIGKPFRLQKCGFIFMFLAVK